MPPALILRPALRVRRPASSITSSTTRFLPGFTCMSGMRRQGRPCGNSAPCPWKRPWTRRYILPWSSATIPVSPSMAPRAGSIPGASSTWLASWISRRGRNSTRFSCGTMLPRPPASSSLSRTPTALFRTWAFPSLPWAWRRASTGLCRTPQPCSWNR